MNHIETYYEKFSLKDFLSPPKYQKMVSDALFNFAKEVLKNTSLKVSMLGGDIIISDKGLHGRIAITKKKNSIEIIPIGAFKKDTNIECIELILYLNELLDLDEFEIKNKDIPEFINKKLNVEEFELQKSMRKYNL